MNPHFYADYQWNKGLPCGITGKDIQEVSYKIVSDPYRKRITVEKYLKNKFSALVYDSSLLDFRKLNPMEQMAWQRETIEETSEQSTCLIRNGDDRVILIEKYHFEEGRSRECHVFSPHGWHLSTHRMYYTLLQDPFNGVILSDAQNKCVMKKTYSCDASGEFTDLLEENWNLAHA